MYNHLVKSYVSFGQVDEAKVELKEVVEFLRSPEKFTKLGGKLPSGMVII